MIITRETTKKRKEKQSLAAALSCRNKASESVGQASFSLSVQGVGRVIGASFQLRFIQILYAPIIARAGRICQSPSGSATFSTPFSMPVTVASDTTR